MEYTRESASMYSSFNHEPNAGRRCSSRDRSSGRKPAAVHDHICHAELRQMTHAVFAREYFELVVQLLVENRDDTAVSVHRFLPVRHGMQHVVRMVSRRPGDRYFRDREGLLLTRDPQIDCGNFKAGMERLCKGPWRIRRGGGRRPRRRPRGDALAPVARAASRIQHRPERLSPAGPTP